MYMSNTQEAEVYVGEDYNIKASHGYAGIMEGVVTVSSIIYFHAVPREYGLAWFDADIQNIPDTGDKYYTESVDAVYQTITQPWVCYFYPNGEEDGDCYMPLSTFQDHVTSC